jgi:mannose-6-phosphate isomerase-like protein (cupin superfamily)
VDCHLSLRRVGSADHDFSAMNASEPLPHTHSTDQLLYFLEGEGVVGAQVTGGCTGQAGWR